MKLTRSQLRMLRAARNGYRCRTGNEERTARSLIRRGLAEYDPPGTAWMLYLTPAGRELVRSC